MSPDLPRADSPEAAESPQPRALRARQRQKLIDACISALHIHGPSKTTVEKVVAIAQMSPGIVRFYFTSKDAMLVAALESLAAEFEEQLLIPVTALAADPVTALKRLVDLYLGVDLASTRKVSVWYSFWGEASSRQEYYEICGGRDTKFERLVRDLIERLIRDQRTDTLDADAIALGLTGVLELLWQSFAFQAEEGIDRSGARRRAMAYLRSIFPSAFTDRMDTRIDRLAPEYYTRPGRYRWELTRLLAPSWQFIGLTSDVPLAGNALAVDGAAGPILLVRTHEGTVTVLQNTCPRRAHLLLLEARASLEHIRCDLHDLTYALDGTPTGPTPNPRLTTLESTTIGSLLFVRAGGAPAPAAPALPALLCDGIDGTRAELTVAADWKILVELWLERTAPEGIFLAPNQWLVPKARGFTLLQVVPLETGTSHLQAFCYPPPDDPQTLTDRLRSDARLAESVQRGLEWPSATEGFGQDVPPAVAQFRQSIAALDAHDPHASGDLR